MHFSLTQDSITSGAAASPKPIVLVLSCADGQLESQELSPYADVITLSELTDCTQLTDQVCSCCVSMMVGPNVNVDPILLDRCPRLKIVLRHGIGFDNIDINHAGRLGIIVCNIPDYGVEEIADTVMAHTLSLFRQTTAMHNAILENKKVTCYETSSSLKCARRIRGKTLGLIGLGKTGIAVALRAMAFGFKVIFCDPYTSNGLDRAIGGLERSESVMDVIAKSDCVSLHCVLTKDTKHLINSSMLGLFKKGAFLVNVSSGALVEEEALARALKQGRLGGAALDVHESEPFSFEDSPLKEAPNVICTPHIAWYSNESFLELRMSAIQMVKLVFSKDHGVNVQDCVNKDFLDQDACRARWCADETD